MEKRGVMLVGGKGGEVKIDYRSVHEFTITDDVEYIKPKKRVY